MSSAKPAHTRTPFDIILAIMTSALGWLFGAHDIPELVYAPTVASIKTRRSLENPDKTQVEEVSLRDLVEKRCPSLHNTFTPAWWLPSGHLQTAYCVVGDFSRVDKLEYERTLLQTLDGGTLGLDFAPSPTEPHLREDTPIVVVLHGLTGGSHESYVRAILAPACAPPDQGGLGYRAVVVNFRGCAGVPLTSPQLYSAGHTDDIRTALLYISHLYPTAPLLGVGFSLGANVLTRYLAQEGESSRLMSGCAIACPWDLLANSLRLRNSWWRRHIYSKALGGNLKGLLKLNLATFEAHPEAKVNVDIQAIMKQSSTTLHDFDNTITRQVGGSSPPFPFPCADDYYVWASSHRILGDVRVPHLCLNAKDDPIVGVLPTDQGADGLGPWIVFGTTKKGGHLAWFEEGSSAEHPHRWFHRPTLEWLRTMGEEVIPPAQVLPEVREVDGYLKEVGNETIGCKVVEGGGHVVGIEGEGGLMAGL
ncbi:AB-hydrolase YheT [Cytidiella melzeri]|nr:AB-hydrolase YheT [Cytidiella melzeri]